MGKKFSWLEYDEDCKVFCNICRISGKSLQRTGGVLVTKSFTNWKKAVEKKKAHEKSDLHSTAHLAFLAVEGAARGLNHTTASESRQKREDEKQSKSDLHSTAHLAFLAVEGAARGLNHTTASESRQKREDEKQSNNQVPHLLHAPYHPTTHTTHYKLRQTG